MARHAQAFYATKTLRKVIRETLSMQKQGVPDINSNSVIIKLLSELPDNFEEIRFMSDLP